MANTDPKDSALDAVRHFTKVTPDAWRIEEVRTVEYHDPVRDAQLAEEERLRAAIIGCILIVALCVLFLTNFGLALAH